MKRREFLWRAAAAVGGAGMLPACAPRHGPTPAAPLMEQTDVFVAGSGYPTYRIPSLLTTRRDTLLAFSEGRQAKGDHTENEIVLRRSGDHGRSWGEMQRLVGDRPNVLVNPTSVEDRGTGRIWLMYQRYPEAAREREVVAGLEGDRICRSFIIHSDDDGRSWSAPAETTRSVKRPSVATSLASGPGIGIQLRRGPHKGRLIVPFNQGPPGAWKVYAAYSDDHGRSWTYGETAPDSSTPGTGNEVQVVELPDGSVMLNARNQAGNHCRKTALSHDGGESWSALEDDPALIEPQCQGSIVRLGDPLDGKRSLILFSNPASTSARVNGTVRLSYDEGKSWPVSRVIHPGSFAYSCLSVLGDGTVGLLYERDDYGKIAFARFDLAWLLTGKDAFGTVDPPRPLR
jgi:sialidase-1